MKKIITTILLLGTLATASASINANLKYGQRGDEVTELQEFLVDAGFLTASPTGYFGLLTLKAVKNYQKIEGLPSTGYVGILTRGKINEALAIDISVSNEAEVLETGTTTVSTTTVPTSTIIYLPVPQYIYVPQEVPKEVVAPVMEKAVTPIIQPSTEVTYTAPIDYTPDISLEGTKDGDFTRITWIATGFHELLECKLEGEKVNQVGVSIVKNSSQATVTLECSGRNSRAKSSKILTIN